MANIKEQRQYQTYLKILDALRQNGYKAEEFENKKNCVRANIARGSEVHGEVFAVVPRPSGCLLFLLGGIGKIIVTQSTYNIMHGMVNHRQTVNGKIQAIWSSDDCVCCCTSEPNPNYSVYEWLEIAKPILK